MKISLLHPSRERARKAFIAFEEWIALSSKEHEIEHILSLDNDDKQLGEYQRLFKHTTSKILIQNNDCVVQAANHAAANSCGEILIYLSDDFGCPQNWDILIFNKIGHLKSAILRVNDLLQPMLNEVLTIPIMTRGVYSAVGYFFYPEYKSMWCDVDLYWSTKTVLIIAPELIFEHRHHSVRKCEMDDTYRRSNDNFQSGLQIYNRRAAQFGWPHKLR